MPRPVFDAAQLDEVRYLRRTGWTLRAIAAAFDVAPNTIRNVLLFGYRGYRRGSGENALEANECS